MRLTLLFFAAIICVTLGRAWAVDTTEIENPELQTRYRELTHELRCVKCQNQSIADSPADLATDLRREVRDQLVAGKSDDEIRDFMVARYGDFILFRPRFSARSAWLWLAPAVLLLVGAFAAVRIVRHRTALVDQDTDPAGDSLQEEPSKE
jgi:cytochrome c-type biogenesis protein CcmH